MKARKMLKLNPSNATTADSINAEIAADGNNVTSIQPVVRASADNGATFGPLLKLSANGTISRVG
jgi:hypothetical protein